MWVPITVSRKGESITLSISDRDKAQLEELALELGMMWGDRPNISKLVEAIARKQIQISKNNDWSRDRIYLLDKAFRLFIDRGDYELAHEIATLLIERSELASPLRRDIEKFLGNPPPIWRQTIDRYIKRNQPFRLLYFDAADRPFSFSIRHAHITNHDSREYLDCWCEETEGNKDIAELQHNRCLRLDRIFDASVTLWQTKWRSQLDQISVTMHLSGTLASAYKPKTGDIDDIWLSDRPVRQITRTITSTFWFYREILPYAEDCIIIAPDDVRQKFIHKVQLLYSRYLTP